MTDANFIVIGLALISIQLAIISIRIGRVASAISERRSA